MALGRHGRSLRVYEGTSLTRRVDPFDPRRSLVLDHAEVGSTANSYEILAKLATGGMAELFLARGIGSVGVARYVVLKRILREFATNKRFVQMFIDEARLVSQLQHPNIAQVHDVGKLGDSYFFTMEYVHGETVRSLLQHTRAKGREFSVAAVLAIGAGAAAGLEHAHERIGVDGRPLGIVHRDVTPSNIMVSFEGNVKVVDFGVAKAIDRNHDTKSGTVKGKTTYLSPEQCKGMELDRRSDLFSLGIVMWEMLTCERLYRRGSEFESMSAIVNDDPPPPSTIRKDLPPEIDKIIGKLLARDRDDRYATAAQVIEDIENAAVANKLRLSATTLARMLKETFGVRPEPWSILEVAAMTVTVTAADMDESQLKKLPGLELVIDDDVEDSDLAIPRAPVLPARPRNPSKPPLDESDGVMAVMEDQPTSRWTVLTPMPEIESAPIAAPPERRSSPPLPAPPEDAPTEIGGPMMLAPELDSGPVSPPQFDSSTVADEDHVAPLGMPRQKKLIIAALAGAGLLTIVAIAIAMSAKSGGSPAPLAIDAAVVARVMPDAAVAVDATAIAIDAAAVVVAVDAAPASRPPLAPTPPSSPRPPPVKPRFSKADLTKDYESAQYAKVVSTCAAGALGVEPSLCVMAACRVGNASKAKQWYAATPAKRHASLLQTCMSLGVALVGTGIQHTEP